MKKSSRILVLVCALLMLGAYIFPIWTISLEAPQYPEGLQMNILINNITGDVDKVNGLNHYIGMKHIHAEEFVELKALPYLIAFFIGFGLLTYWKNSKKLLYAWTVMLLAFGIAGAVDFYLWEYDYGHNLDPMAAIKVPGMSYQPPLLGYKQLLNFLAGSFPAIGGWMVITPILTAFTISIVELRSKKKVNHEKLSASSAAVNRGL
ncbi:hypothetical protein NF867_13870 [Solitalea sp. MAHUQ-68]|uniref:Copper chaperone NosL n=1 Tax=Solitalea agri TaxID=2953739 RepID=A0A9X2JDB4_9SPHI|nr:hypothetical protein [Solitalea agri]MCO4293948.1 hypothetical protein [Solitalea agri]